MYVPNTVYYVVLVLRTTILYFISTLITVREGESRDGRVWASGGFTSGVEAARGFGCRGTRYFIGSDILVIASLSAFR